MSNAAVSALHTLEQQVRPLTLARERLLPVCEDLAALFAAGGIPRGSVLACTGPAPLSLALALAGEASRAGSWVGVVGLPVLGTAAAVEQGVALERMLHVAEPPPALLATVLAAVTDGVDVVIAKGTGVGNGDARRLAARLATKGGMLLLAGSHGGFSPDFVCRVTAAQWEGLGRGYGCLVSRRVTVECAGRRAAQPRRIQLTL